MSDFSPIDASDGPVTAWVSVAEAAERSGVRTSTVRQWYRSGRIPTQRAERERGAFLVPLHAVIALAQQAPEDGEELGEAALDPDAGYFVAQTEAAREEATAAQDQLAQARAELVDAQRELTAAHDQLAFLRSQLSEASEDRRTFQNEVASVTAERDRLRRDNEHLRRQADELASERERVARLEQELAKMRMITSATASITDNSWLDLPTNTYQSPVRPQGRSARDALSDLLASTQRDPAHGRDGDADAGELTPLRPPEELAEPPVPASGAMADEEAQEPAPGPRFSGFGHSDDDLLPQPEKKGRRGRK